MFDYYFEEQANQFSFIQISKELLVNKQFAELSTQSKVLYGLLLDRMSQARKNHWVDDKDRAFIIYPVDEIVKELNSSKRKVLGCLAELEETGLVERQKQGNGRPNRIYVKNFILESAGA